VLENDEKCYIHFSFYKIVFNFLKVKKIIIMNDYYFLISDSNTLVLNLIMVLQMYDKKFPSA